MDPDGLAFTDRLLALCSLDALGASGLALVGSLGLVGLIGGAMHCAPMCGPFVLAQGQYGSARSGRFARTANMVALPYHLGRLTTYAGLGGLSGAVGGLVVSVAGFHEASAALLLIAAMFFAAQAARALGFAFPWPAPMRRVATHAGWFVTRRIGPLGRRLSRAPRWLRGYAMGLVLGFLPCGLLYSALFAAAGSGSLSTGAIVMASFAAGTVPALAVLGLTGHAATRLWPRSFQRLSCVMLCFGTVISLAFAIDRIR